MPSILYTFIQSFNTIIWQGISEELISSERKSLLRVNYNEGIATSSFNTNV
jgi:hypothetical protein